MREQLRAFITADLIRDPGYPLQDDEALITGGLIDSFSLVQLQLFIDETFGVFIDDTEMTVANMNTLDSIIAHIETSKG
jgi:acyl carrier protein